MRKIVFFIIAVLLYQASFSQSVYPIRADMVRIYKQGGSAELILENSTKDSTGVLVNIGGGRTRFMKGRALDDSTIVIGLDTIVIRGATGGGGGASITISNVGGGNELAKALSGSNYPFRTIVNGFGINWAQATNTLTGVVDTAAFSKTVIIPGYGVDGIYSVPVVAGQDDTLRIKSDTGEVSSLYALQDSIRATDDLVQGNKLLVQGKVSTERAAAGALAAIELSDGAILTVYEFRGSIQNDFFPADLYYSIYKDNKILNKGILSLPVSKTEISIPNLWHLSNDTIGMLFTGYTADNDNPLYKTKLKFNLSDYSVTATTPVIIDSPTVFQLIYHDRLWKDSDGVLWLAAARHHSGTTGLSNTGSHYKGRVFKSTDNGATWSLLPIVISATDSSVFEPGIYESSIDFNRPHWTGTQKHVFYWRTRSGTISYVESTDGFATVSAAMNMGIAAQNSPLVVKRFKDRIYAVVNRMWHSASGQTQVRNQMDVYASSKGEQEFHSVMRLAGNESDTMFVTAPSIHLLGNRLFVSHSYAGESAGEANLYLIELNKATLDAGVREYDAFYSKINVAGGNDPEGVNNRKMLNLYNVNGGEANGHIHIGNLNTSSSHTWYGGIESKVTSGTNLGLSIYSTVGNDGMTDAGSAGLAVNVFSPSSGTVSTIPLFRVLNNSSLKFSLDPDGYISNGKLTQDVSVFNLSQNLRSSGSITSLSAGGINGGISYDNGTIVGTFSNHFLEFWTNNAQRAVLTTTGNWLFPATAYHNWGTTEGSSGYGIRSNAGTMQFKNSGGSWTDFGTGGGGGSTTLAGLTDVNLTSPAGEDGLVFDGTDWINSPVLQPDGTFTTNNIPLISAANKLTASPMSYNSGSNVITTGSVKFQVGNSITVTDGTINGIMSFDAGAVFGTSSNHAVQFFANGAEVLRLTTAGNLRMNTGTYINYSGTEGSTGFGIRESSGNIQFKNSGGSWHDFVGLTATQTLTNKTLTAPQINGAKLETSSTVGQVWTASGTDGSGAWATPTVTTSGTYTPTLTNVTNVSSSTPGSCQYMRVGNTVTVSGDISVTPTAEGQIEIGVSLPVASDFSATSHAGGTGASTTDHVLRFSGDTTNDRVKITGFLSNTVVTISFSFTYRVTAP